ncbi:glycosyl transferase, partial [Candidatus Shapirobacteria bacterium CG03_land_8_20_14_0_80_35_14]
MLMTFLIFLTMPLNTSKNFKTSPKVSIVIPTLNSAKVIKKCLDSIVIQKYTNYEILICDGGSTDETLKISKKY